MKNLENKCEHKYVYEIGSGIDLNGNKYKIGNCFVCEETLIITEDYKKMKSFRIYNNSKAYFYKKNDNN